MREYALVLVTCIIGSVAGGLRESPPFSEPRTERVCERSQRPWQRSNGTRIFDTQIGRRGSTRIKP